MTEEFKDNVVSIFARSAAQATRTRPSTYLQTQMDSARDSISNMFKLAEAFETSSFQSSRRDAQNLQSFTQQAQRKIEFMSGGARGEITEKSKEKLRVAFRNDELVLFPHFISQTIKSHLIERRTVPVNELGIIAALTAENTWCPIADVADLSSLKDLLEDLGDIPQRTYHFEHLRHYTEPVRLTVKTVECADIRRQLGAKVIPLGALKS